MSAFCAVKIHDNNYNCYTYVMPTGMQETPKVALDIHCLQQGGGAALTQTINLIPPPRGDGGAQAITA